MSVAAVKRKPLSDIEWGSSRYLGRKDPGEDYHFTFLLKVSIIDKKEQMFEKRGEKCGCVQYCTVMPIVLCDLKVTTFIVLP